MTEQIQAFDFAILDGIQNSLACDFLDVLMPLISFLGNGGLIYFLTAGVMLIFRRYRACGVNILLFMAIGAVAASLILKPLIARDRPCWINEAHEMLVAVPQDFSFPSGHTLHAFGLATVAMFYDKRIGIPALIFAVLMGFSRMYLYVHFPTDVLCGAILGVSLALGTVALARVLFKSLSKRFSSFCDM